MNCQEGKSKKSYSQKQHKINEKNKTIAQKKVKKICDDLRIYNPLVSKITLEIFED